MTTGIGDYVITMIDGSTRTFIGEVVKNNPLVIKVCEQGVMSNIKDPIIWEKETTLFQSSENAAYSMMKKYSDNGVPLLSGLKSLGVDDNELHSILSPDN